MLMEEIVKAFLAIINLNVALKMLFTSGKILLRLDLKGKSLDQTRKYPTQFYTHEIYSNITKVFQLQSFINVYAMNFSYVGHGDLVS